MDSIWWNIINNLQSNSSKSKNELFNHSCYNHLPYWINLSWQHRLEQTFQQCQQPQKKWHERPWLQRTNAPTFQQQRPTCPTKISPIPPISKTININTKHQKHRIPTKSCPNDNCSIEPVLLYCSNNQINHYKISTIRLFFIKCRSHHWAIRAGRTAARPFMFVRVWRCLRTDSARCNDEKIFICDIKSIWPCWISMWIWQVRNNRWKNMTFNCEYAWNNMIIIITTRV